MNPPFAIEQFLSVFAAYNAAIWPAQIVAYVVGLVAVAAVWSRRQFASRLVPSILALMWAWNGIAYHFLFFSTINPAAKIFAAFFLLQAILFAVLGLVATDIQFKIGRDFRSHTGIAIVIYAIMIYPILAILAGHGMMAGPMFGVAPCPTTIFTIGLLLFARGKWIAWLSIIPLLWSIVGLAAALQLGIPEDLGLPVAGSVLLMLLAADLVRARSGSGTAAPC